MDRAASNTDVPTGACTIRPSMVTVTRATFPYLPFPSVPLYYYEREIATSLHFSKQVPHLIHFAGSILCGSFFSPSIAPTGQALLQRPQPVHFASSMLKTSRAEQR